MTNEQKEKQRADYGFIKFEKLSDHIQRMASTGHVGNTIEWSDFLLELDKALESQPKQEIREWQPIDDSAKSGKKILLSLLNILGNRRVIVGFWVDKFSIEDNSDEYEFGDFNEKDEMYYWPEGWYESIESHDDFSCVPVGKESITHWMPLPSAPL